MINKLAFIRSVKYAMECHMFPSASYDELRKFFDTNGDMSVLSSRTLFELSSIYPNIIAPYYKEETGGEYLPNVFAQYNDEED